MDCLPQGWGCLLEIKVWLYLYSLGEQLVPSSSYIIEEEDFNLF